METSQLGVNQQTDKAKEIGCKTEYLIIWTLEYWLSLIREDTVLMQRWEEVIWFYHFNQRIYLQDSGPKTQQVRYVMAKPMVKTE